jgi:hypothetical protein
MQVTLAHVWALPAGEGKSMLESARRPRKANIAMLAVLLILAALVVQPARPVAVSAASGRVIDLHTQKAPFDGKGINQSSDAFEPQDSVVLYALVTYNDAPVAQKLVAFQVNGPANPLLNITTVGSASTGQDGIAQFSFRIPWPNDDPEKKIFGQWFAIATVSIADQTVIDTLTFKVGWIIKITNIETLNDQLKPQTRFLRREAIVFNLTVENIALTEKSATITIDVQDATNHPIIHVQKENLVFQPGTTYLTVSSQVPTTATIGQASISAAAYTWPPENGGVLCSPAFSATFEIITRDVAMTAVKPSSTFVTSGQTLNITVTVENKGDETESFNVTAYYDNTPIGKILVAGISPQMQTNIIFEWNTSGVPSGNYVISGVADTVEGEIETADNTYVDGAVTIVPSILPFIIPDWIILLFMFVVALIASLILLLFLGYLRRRRRRKPSSRLFTVVAHPHI